jgi:hypothetical protein
MYVTTQHLAPEIKTTLCKYTILNNGIHYLKLAVASQAAVNEWLRCMDHIFKHTPNRKQVFTLTDASQTVIPALGYATHLNRLWMLQANDNSSRNAILHPAGPLSPGVVELTELLLRNHKHNISYFEADDRLGALNWLLSRE